jgi:hypothetical protein
LAQVVLALRRTSSLTSLAQGRQQHRGKDGNNRNYDQ